MRGISKKGVTSTHASDKAKEEARKQLEWRKANESRYTIKEGKLWYKHEDCTLVPLWTTCNSNLCKCTHQ